MTIVRVPERRSSKLLAIGGLAAVAVIGSLGLYAHHADTFQHDTGRLLRELSTASGIEVTLHTSVGSANAPSSLQVHGILLPKATATANEVTFDGRLSYVHMDFQYNFTLLNDRAYITVEDLNTTRLTHSECLHPENIPPIAELTHSLKNARVIDAVGSAAKFNVACPTNKLVKIDFAGEPYVLCAAAGSEETGPGTVAVTGDDLQASLTLLGKNSQGLPSLASLAPPAGLDLNSCRVVDAASGDASISLSRRLTETVSRATQRTHDAIQVATGGRRLGKMGSTDCGCTGGKKQCLFIHGFGSEDPGAATDTHAYFGTIHEQLPCCSSIKFARLDTNDEPWYSDKLTTEVCETAVAMTGATNPLAIENIAVIAHSMGNLVMSAAIMNNKCGLAANSKWISLAGPIYGSMISTTILRALDALPPATLEKWCENDPNTVLDDPIFSVLDSFSLCSTRASLRSIAFKGSVKSTPELDALFTKAGEVFKSKISANMCGVSAIGLLSGDSAKMALQGTIAGHASSANDGQVHFDSCRSTIEASRYSTKWSGGAFYRASVNHLDITTRHGDGWWGDDRKPVKWLQCQF